LGANALYVLADRKHPAFWQYWALSDYVVSSHCGGQLFLVKRLEEAKNILPLSP
jgi:hypothetical protein